MEDCICKDCGTKFESTSRIDATAITVKLVSVDPCPECGKKELIEARVKE